MDNALDQLSQLSGISKPEMLAIWATVKENHRRLDACERHDFTIPRKVVGPLTREWECTRCGGTVDNINKSWYERGLRDAGTP